MSAERGISEWWPGSSRRRWAMWRSRRSWSTRMCVARRATHWNLKQIFVYCRNFKWWICEGNSAMLTRWIRGASRLRTAQERYPHRQLDALLQRLSLAGLNKIVLNLNFCQIWSYSFSNTWKHNKHLKGIRKDLNQSLKSFLFRYKPKYYSFVLDKIPQLSFRPNWCRPCKRGRSRILTSTEVYQ